MKWTVKERNGMGGMGWFSADYPGKSQSYHSTPDQKINQEMILAEWKIVIHSMNESRIRLKQHLVSYTSNPSLDPV